MKPHFGLTNKVFNTQFAPLCLVGHTLQHQNRLKGLLQVKHFDQKNRTYAPGEKLMDAFLLILAGYPSLSLINSTLRPDPILAKAWMRDQLAEQSTISRTLDRANELALLELRTVSWDFWQQYTRLNQHDWRTPLLLDLDLSPLPASSNAEGSTKGYMGEKTQLGVN